MLHLKTPSERIFYDFYNFTNSSRDTNYDPVSTPDWSPYYSSSACVSHLHRCVRHKRPCSFPAAVSYHPHPVYLHKHLAGEWCRAPLASHVQILSSPWVLLGGQGAAWHCTMSTRGGGSFAWRCPQAGSSSRRTSWAVCWLSAVACSSELKLIIPHLGSWSYSSILPSMGIYSKLSKGLKKKGSRGTCASLGNCWSQFFTNEQLVSLTHWWGHVKYPLRAACLQRLALSIGWDSARYLT